MIFSKQKGSTTLIILVVLFLIAAGGATYYFLVYQRQQATRSTTITTPTPTPSQISTPAQPSDETADWQIYQNDKYKYTIKYPKDWYFHKTGYGPPPPTVIMIANVPEGQGIRDYASFWVGVDQAMGRTLENYEEITNLVSKGYTKTATTVSGQEAVRLETTEPTKPGFYIYFKYGQYIFRLDGGATNNALYQTHKSTLEKIAKSFKLI